MVVGTTVLTTGVVVVIVNTAIIVVLIEFAVKFVGVQNVFHGKC